MSRKPSRKPSSKASERATPRAPSKPTRDALKSDAPSHRDTKTARAKWAALAGLGGFLEFLAFAGVDAWPLAFVCFVPMMFVVDHVAARGVVPRKRSRWNWLIAAPLPLGALSALLLSQGEITGGAIASALFLVAIFVAIGRLLIAFPGDRVILAYGAIQGFVGSAFGYSWLVEMLEVFSGFHAAICVLFASIFFFYRGLKETLVYWLCYRARLRHAPWIVAGVCGLVAGEFAFPDLFPAFVASGFHQVPAFIQIADLGGPMLLSGVALSVNAALYLTIRAKRRPQGPGEGTPWPTRAIGIAAAALVFTLGYGAYRIAEVDGRQAARAEVGMVQVSMGIFERTENPRLGLRLHQEESRRLEEAHPELDLIVWSESAFAGFIHASEENISRRVSGGLHTPLLFGGLSRREHKLYNTAFLADGQGDLKGHYDKTYLLMFGEYLPFGEYFPELYEISRNSSRFEPGDHIAPLLVDALRIGTLICYEDVLPRFTREVVQTTAPNLLVNITNDAWFGDTAEPWIHLALAKFRAVEHHRALVRSTNSGVSAIIDPVGRVVTEIGVNEVGSAAAEVALLDGATLYQTLGDWPGWLSLLVMVWLGWGYRARQKEVSEKEVSAKPS